MDVKKILRDNNISLSDFANDLGISRPTLYAYIDMYERGLIIPKKKYQKIFSVLFDCDNLDDFHLIYNNLFNRNSKKILNDIDGLKDKLLKTTIENIENDFKTAGWNEDVYKFINIILSSYKREPLFSHVIRYFLVLNGQLDYRSIDFEDEKYLLYYYQMFSNDKYNRLDYNYQLEKEFIDRINEIQLNKNKKNNSMEKLILEKIKQEINVLQELGIELSNDELREFLINKLNL